MDITKKIRQQIKENRNLQQFIFEDGSFELIKEVPEGKLVHIIDDIDELNSKAYIKTADDVSGSDIFTIGDVPGKFVYIIEKRVNNGPNSYWEKVPNPTALQPIVLVENGTLVSGDVIRFLDIENKSIFAVDTDQETLIDMHGLFYVGISYLDFDDAIGDMLSTVLYDDNDEDNDDDENINESTNLNEILSDAEIEIIPASPMIEYLGRYGGVIKNIGKIVDEIEQSE